VLSALARRRARAGVYNGGMALEQLLGEVPPSVFLGEYYLKLPYARAGGCRHLTHLAGWETVEAILARPGVDVLAGRGGSPWRGAGPPSPAEARVLLAEGYTLGIRHAERHDAGLGGLAAGFRRDFAAPVDVHLYCTPADQPGFGWHYDAEDVFVLQAAGGKEWELRKNTVNPWPLVETLPADMRHEREVTPLLRCLLRPGDWLYIPAGYWHRTRAGEESISLSVGVLSASAVEVYDFLRKRLLDSLRWRQRLPTPGRASPLGEGELLRRYQDLFTELGNDLAALLGREDLARAFLAERRRAFP
jgi:ribosomal protein L16 Arg81 hydroxylase